MTKKRKRTVRRTYTIDGVAAYDNVHFGKYRVCRSFTEDGKRTAYIMIVGGAGAVWLNSDGTIGAVGAGDIVDGLTVEEIKAALKAEKTA